MIRVFTRGPNGKKYISRIEELTITYTYDVSNAMPMDFIPPQLDGHQSEPIRNKQWYIRYDLSGEQYVWINNGMCNVSTTYFDINNHPGWATREAVYSQFTEKGIFGYNQRNNFTIFEA